MIPRSLPWLESTWLRLPPLVARGVHAVLLHGAAGIGKKSLALDFAAALLCAAPRPDGRACGQCEECRLTTAFTHPDLRWVLPQALADSLLPAPADGDEAIDEGSGPEAGAGEAKATRASREIRVDQVRALSDFLGIAAYRGGRRVVLLAPAEAMNAIAASTLLKMLEEPPPQTTFVLVSDALDDLLPTIRSRCVLVQVPVPSARECLPWLAEQGLDDPQSALALASGAPLAALAEKDATASPEAIAVLYGLLERGPALTAAQIVAGVGREPPVAACIRRMHCWALDLLHYRARSAVRYHPRHAPTIARLAAAAREPELWRWLEALKTATAAREHPLNARLVVESLLTGYLGIFHERG